MTLLITPGSDQDEVLFLTENVCENEKNPLQSKKIFSSVADSFSSVADSTGSCLVSRNI